MWLDNLTRFKKASGLTLDQIAEVSGVPLGTLNKLFSGQTKNPQLSTISAVVHSMGYSLDDLSDDPVPLSKPTLNERVKELRQALGLTQQEFAARIGSVQNTITGYETGRRSPSGQVISLICKEFHVNETWLRTGEGEMFLPQSTDLVDQLSREFGLGLYGQQLLATYLGLSEADKRAVERFVAQLVQNVQTAEDQLETSAAESPPKEKRFNA